VGNEDGGEEDEGADRAVETLQVRAKDKYIWVARRTVIVLWLLISGILPTECSMSDAAT
jgi:hypothetical protein